MPYLPDLDPIAEARSKTASVGGLFHVILKFLFCRFYDFGAGLFLLSSGLKLNFIMAGLGLVLNAR